MARLTEYQRWDRSNAIKMALFGVQLAYDQDVVKDFEGAFGTSGRIAMYFWFRQILPGHFERFAHAKYRYKEREQAWIRFKVRKYPANRGLDLIMTGRLKETALAAPRRPPTVLRKATGFVMRVVVQTTDYVAKNPYVNMHREIIAHDATDMLLILEQLTVALKFAFGYS